MQRSPDALGVRTNKPTPSIQSLDRGLMILEAVARSRRPVATAELAELLAIDHSSAFRLANTLKRRGFLACPGGRTDYVLGPRHLAPVPPVRLEQHAGPGVSGAPETAGRRSRETAHLAVREGRQALFVDHVTANHVIVVSGQTGESVPLHCTAHGRPCWRTLEAPTGGAFRGRGTLGRRRRGRRFGRPAGGSLPPDKGAGYATDDEEFHEGIRCVAAPIRDKDGVVIASIGISAPSARLPE